MKKKKGKKKPKINPILSHVNDTFSILNLRIGPQGFEHTHHTLKILLIFNMKKGPIQASICFKLIPELLIL